MSDATRIKSGFWAGIVLLFAGLLWVDFCAAQGIGGYTGRKSVDNCPLSVLGLKSNRETYMLAGA